MRNPFIVFFPTTRRRRRDFNQAPTNKNPMFTQQGNSPGIPWVGLVFLLAILGGASYLVFSPLFQITTVNVDGTEKLNRDSIVDFVNERLNEKTLGFLRLKRSSLLINTSSIGRQIEENAEKLVPLASVVVTKPDRHQLKVTIKEEIPEMMWQTGTHGTRYFLGSDGIVLEIAPDTLVNDLPTLEDNNTLDVVVGSRIVNPKILTALKIIRDRLPTLNIQTKSFSTWKVECPSKSETDVADSNLNKNVNTSKNNNSQLLTDDACDKEQLAKDEPSFTVATTEGWEIRFTAAADIDIQISKLASVLRQRLTTRAGLRYIDVRFGDRVFFQ